MRRRVDGSGAPSLAVLGVLFALGDRELHGYGIMKEVEERTAGRVSLLPSSLYATIKRMLADGLIEDAGTAPAGGPGRPRRHYRITEVGRELAGREAQRIAALLELARENRLVGDTPVRDAGG